MTTQTIQEWVLENYSKEIINQISDHGCVSGCAPGLIYYHETVAFHDEHEQEIWEMLYQDADDQGVTVMELIAHFKGQKNVYSINRLKNLLTWYAVEQVCANICIWGLMKNGTVE